MNNIRYKVAAGIAWFSQFLMVPGILLAMFATWLGDE